MEAKTTVMSLGWPDFMVLTVGVCLSPGRWSFESMTQPTLLKDSTLRLIMLTMAQIDCQCIIIMDLTIAIIMKVETRHGKNYTTD